MSRILITLCLITFALSYTYASISECKNNCSTDLLNDPSCRFNPQVMDQAMIPNNTDCLISLSHI
jgi:hypothetical protein